MNITTLLAQSQYYTSDPYYYSDTGMSDASAAAGFGAVTILLMLFVSVIAYVVMGIFLSRIFKKAGEDGWKAWVPVYNTWTMLELGGQKGYWAILAIIPIINIVAIVFMFIAMYQIGLNLGKDGAFVLLAIFLPIVWMIWLAVDNSTWKGAKPAGAAATPSKKNDDNLTSAM